MAKQTVNERLYNYIDKVCTDAIKSVGCDAAMDQWFMIIGDDLVVDLKFTKKPYAYMDEVEILKRIMFRLGNNVPKHFNLSVHAPRLYHHSPDNVGSMYSFFPNGEFNYGYALAEVHPFDEDLVLCHEYGYPVYPVEDTVDFDNLPTTRLQENGFDIHNRYFFSDFYTAYVRTFGESPLNVWIQMRQGKDISKIGSSESIEEMANNDLDTYGCKYYSVCNKACKGCTATDRCYREKPIMKDGLVLSRYRNFKQELLMGKM